MRAGSRINFAGLFVDLLTDDNSSRRVLRGACQCITDWKELKGAGATAKPQGIRLS